MKEKQKEYYLLDNSYQNLYKLGFRYSSYDECYILIFPLMRYKNRPTILCKLKFNKVDNHIKYDIIKTNRDLLGIYYNRKYGNAKKYVQKIDKKVYRRLYQMGIYKITSKKYNL